MHDAFRSLLRYFAPEIVVRSPSHSMHCVRVALRINIFSCNVSCDCRKFKFHAFLNATITPSRLLVGVSPTRVKSAKVEALVVFSWKTFQSSPTYEYLSGREEGKVMFCESKSSLLFHVHVPFPTLLEKKEQYFVNNILQLRADILVWSSKT